LTDIKIRNNIRLIETTMEVGNMSIQGIDKSNVLDITKLQESQNIKKANTDFKYMQDIIQSGNGQKDNIVISEEGMNALLEMQQERKPKVDEEAYKLTIQNTNELEMEHYFAMREYSGLTLKDGNYNIEDVMKSMIDAYETRYNQIVKEHENGDRQVSYELTGETSVTLDEDLAGLDRAYNMCLANLEGYITCQQTNKAFANPGDISWYSKRIGMQYSKTISSQDEIEDNYNYLDKSYQDTVIEMMKQAREEFLVQYNKVGYKKGATDIV
jgi:hypothetical protein